MLGVPISAYHLSAWLDIKAADNLVAFLAPELSFPFASFFAQLDSGEHLMRLFRDFFYSPLYLLPSSWWSNWVEDVGQINTALIMGAPKGEQGVTGGIPVDMITLGLMQAAALGIVFVGLLFGVSLRVIQSLLDKVKSIGVRSVFEAYVAIKLAVLALFYAQPSLVVSGNFDLLASIAVIICCIMWPRMRFFGSVKNSCEIKSSSPYRRIP